MSRLKKDIKTEISYGQTGGNGGDDYYMRTTMRVSAVSITINILLAAVKFAAGLIGHSAAMISDAVHSASDVFSTIIVIIGVRIAGRKADSGHPYGHERFESVASIILAFMLAVTGAAIGVSGIREIAAGSYDTLTVPGQMALYAALLSIIVKEGMYWYTRINAKRIGSDALMADAWHHRSDALSSIGSFVGIFFARLGYPVMDPVASVVICVFIIKAAVDIFRKAVGSMVDQACSQEQQDRIREAILSVDGVLGVDLLRTRIFGSRVYVDVEIREDGDITLREAHQVAEEVHHRIEKEFPDVKHCMVHVNPA